MGVGVGGGQGGAQIMKNIGKPACIRGGPHTIVKRNSPF